MIAEGRTGVVLIAHGTVDSLDDLPEFLTNIRRGHPPPPDLLAEVRRRYEAIGGRSPLLDITREVATKLEARLAMPVRVAMRLFRPYPAEALRELAAEGVTRVLVLPLAQHSAPIYGDAVREAAREISQITEVRAASNWGRTPALTSAYAAAIAEALAKVPASERVALVLTAHSLPVSIIEAGDPYEREVRASAEDVARAVRALDPRFTEHVVAFQSQGMSIGPGGRPVAWLGPDLRATLEDLAARGHTAVVVAPIGFLADHVEILYDLDIEAMAWARELSIALYRSASLNADDRLVDALVGVAEGLVGEG
jgi:protoporphyrin/coproporphyrin ferrochelatase